MREYDQPFYTVPAAARALGIQIDELRRAIKWYRTLRASEISPGVFRVSEKALDDYRALKRQRLHRKPRNTESSLS